MPQRYTPKTRDVPGPAEVADWVAAVERLWDDRAFYDRSRGCEAAAAAWRPDVLLDQAEHLFRAVVGPQSRSLLPFYRTPSV